MQKAHNKVADSLARAEQRNGELVTKVQKYKQTAKVMKYATSCQCKFCHAFWPVDSFQQHLAHCQSEFGSLQQRFHQLRVDLAIT